MQPHKSPLPHNQDGCGQSGEKFSESLVNTPAHGSDDDFLEDSFPCSDHQTQEPTGGERTDGMRQRNSLRGTNHMIAPVPTHESQQRCSICHHYFLDGTTQSQIFEHMTIHRTKLFKRLTLFDNMILRRRSIVNQARIRTVVEFLEGGMHERLKTCSMVDQGKAGVSIIEKVSKRQNKTDTKTLPGGSCEADSWPSELFLAQNLKRNDIDRKDDLFQGSDMPRALNILEESGVNSQDFLVLNTQEAVEPIQIFRKWQDHLHKFSATRCGRNGRSVCPCSVCSAPHRSKSKSQSTSTRPINPSDEEEVEILSVSMLNEGRSCNNQDGKFSHDNQEQIQRRNPATPRPDTDHFIDNSTEQRTKLDRHISDNQPASVPSSSNELQVTDRSLGSKLKVRIKSYEPSMSKPEEASDSSSKISKIDGVIRDPSGLKRGERNKRNERTQGDGTTEKKDKNKKQETHSNPETKKRKSNASPPKGNAKANDQENEEYFVEEVLDRRYNITEKRWYFLIKWYHYDFTYCSWEPKDNLYE